MLIGVPKEVKASEFRVGATPHTAAAFIKAGHTVLIEKDAGKAIGFSNEE